MGHVFICYSRKDFDAVDRIVSELEDAGIDYWMDRSKIRAGDNWDDITASNLDKSDTLLLVVSRNSVTSKWVRREVCMADEMDKRIIPVFLHTTALPPWLRYRTTELQQIRLGRGFRRGIDALLKTLGKQEDKRPVRAAESEQPPPSRPRTMGATNPRRGTRHIDRLHDLEAERKQGVFARIKSFWGRVMFDFEMWDRE